MQPSLLNSMPMGASINPPVPLSASLAPLSQPPPQQAPPPAGMPPAGMPPTDPSQQAPQSQYTVRMQPDGTSVYVQPSPDGDPTKDIILGVNKAPKIQPQAPQGIPLAFQPPQPK